MIPLPAKRAASTWGARRRRRTMSGTVLWRRAYPSDDRRRRELSVGPGVDGRPLRDAGPRRHASRARGHRSGAAPQNGGAGPQAERRHGGQGDDRHHDRPPRVARRRRLRHRVHLDRRLPLHGGRPRRAGHPRHHPDGGGHRRARRHQPCPAQRPRPRRHRQGDGGALPGRLALQHHQPHDGVDPVGVPRDQHQDGRPLPRGGQLLHGPGHRHWAGPSRRSRPR